MTIPFLPTISLFLSLMAAALLFRLYAWRGTLSVGTLLLAFGFGSIGATVVSLLLQSIPSPFLCNGPSCWRHTVGFTTGPVYEELAKALPVFLLLAYARAQRRLSLADFALIGFMSGLGFLFVEQNFSRTFTPGFWQPLLGGWDTLWGLRFESVHVFRGGYLYQGPDYWPGHHAITALVGLAAGIGARLWPESPRKWILPLLAVAYATLIHIIFNIEAMTFQPRLNDDHPLLHAFWLVNLYGFLPVIALPLALFAASAWESRRLARAGLGEEPAPCLDGEGRNWFGGEMIAVARYGRFGMAPAGKAFAYVRRRRAAMLARDAIRRADADAADRAYAAASFDDLADERPAAARDGEATSLRAGLAEFARRHRLTLAILGFVVLLIGITPNWQGLVALLHHPALAYALALVSAAFVAWRIRLWFRTPRPQPEAASGEALASYQLQTMLLCASVLTSVLAVLVTMLKMKGLMPVDIDSVYYQHGYISSHLSLWTDRGGSLPTLFGGAAMLGAAAATPNAKPVDLARLQQEIDEAKAQFEELQDQLKAEAAARIEQIDKFNADYDDLWREAIKGTEDYMRDYPELMVDLQKLWEAVGDREWANKVAGEIDDAIETAMVLAPIANAGVGLALRGTRAAAAGRAGAKAAAAGERALAGRAAGRQVETLGVRKGGEAAAGKAARGKKPTIADPEEFAPGTMTDKAREQLRSAMDNAVLITDEALRNAVMKKEVERALRSGAKDGRVVFLGDDLLVAPPVKAAMAAWQKQPGEWLVTLHGNKEGTFTIFKNVGGQMHKVSLTPEELGTMMKMAGYQPGSPVRLLSCWSGSGPKPGAQVLAKMFEAEFYAPRGELGMYKNGMATVLDAPKGGSYAKFGKDGRRIL